MAKKQAISTPWARERAQRARSRDEKKTMVLHTAAREFRARGVHNTSLDQIAELLGVSKPTIYHYFKDKEALLYACMEEAQKQLHNVLKKPEALGSTGREALEVFVRRYVEVIVGDFGHILVMTPDSALQAESRTKLRAGRRVVDKALRRILETGAKDGSIEPGNIRMTASALFGAMNWVARWHMEDSPPPEEIAASFTRLFERGLTPRAGTRSA